MPIAFTRTVGAAHRIVRGWVIGVLLVVGALAVSGADPQVRATALPAISGARVGFTLMEPSVTGVTFTNLLVGDAYFTNAVAHNGSGVALGDVDGDGRTDLYLCGLNGTNQLYRNRGQWRFEPMPLGEAACVGQMSTGAVLVDVDGDGDLDLLVNGIAAGTRLFLNDGHGRWTEKRDSGLYRHTTGTSMALADMDGDGDLDAVITAAGGKPMLLRNDQALGHHFVRLKLVGTKSNRDAIGAWVKLTADGKSQWRQVMPAKSYLSASEPEVTFGLGKSTQVDALEITWPSGKNQSVSPVAIDRLITLQESP